MKQCPDNQINASFIDILRIKWLGFFFIAVVFLPHNYMYMYRLVLVGLPLQALADYGPAPGRTDGIPERQQRQWI